MPTSLPLGQSVAGLFKMVNDKTGADIPANFTNIVFKSLNTGVFGLQTDSAVSTMDFLITGPGNTQIIISADCSFISPSTGKPTTQRKSKTLSLTVTGAAPSWSVSIGE